MPIRLDIKRHESLSIPFCMLLEMIIDCFVFNDARYFRRSSETAETWLFATLSSWLNRIFKMKWNLVCGKLNGFFSSQRSFQRGMKIYREFLRMGLCFKVRWHLPYSKTQVSELYPELYANFKRAIYVIQMWSHTLMRT